MDKGEREALGERIAWLQHWCDLARWIIGARKFAADQGEAARSEFQGRQFTVTIDGRQHRVLVVDAVSDEPLLMQLGKGSSQRALSSADKTALTIGSADVSALLSRASGVVTARRLFMTAGRRREREADAQAVLDMYDRAASEGLAAHLDTLIPATPETAPSVTDLAHQLVGPGAVAMPTGGVHAASLGQQATKRVRQTKDATESEIQQLGTSIRDRDVEQALQEMPIDALKASTSGRLRLGVIEQAGLTSVGDVLEFGPNLSAIAGVGEQTARQTWAAAETMQSMIRRETPVRIDVKRRDAATGRLLNRLWIWGQASGMATRAEEDADIVASLEPLLGNSALIAVDSTSQMVTTSADSAEQLAEALARVTRWDAEAATLDQPPEDSWTDFLARPSDYLGWLNLLGFVTEDEGAAEGLLSTDLIEKVRAQDLDTSLMSGVSLRGYQDFAARFALVQRKVVIGDEMGLGKTIEALALVAHVHAKGATHSIVICPAAVLSNWSREISHRSDLEVFVLHGAERWSRLRRWSRRGGVAVTTFATLKSVLDELEGQDEIHAVVVDEAHYIKNPDAKRTADTRVLIDAADRALLLTGTPIENRLEEFANLVSYLQPDLLRQLGAYSPGAFPKLIAPAYLRRNQEDVLIELPERIEVEEWVPMSPDDEAEYVRAVAQGNFMAMRRAALTGGRQSAKMQRLVELIEEARANYRKVIVFSYFRDVLDAVMGVIDGDVFGPLTGSVPANERQRVVDAYTEAQPGAVLVSQITAGGVGLNIQAGSVVVICEPQVKPSMESQAVARAHRMGQTETVQVHRLLSDEGVDRRMIEILAEKQRLFDEFAKVSHTANSAPEALDITEAELAREVIAAERERLARRAQAVEDSPTPIEESA